VLNKLGVDEREGDSGTHLSGAYLGIQRKSQPPERSNDSQELLRTAWLYMSKKMRHCLHMYHSERSKNIPVVKFRVISNLPRLFLYFTYINFSIIIMLGILAFSFNLQLSNISRSRCVSRLQSDFKKKKNLFPLNHHHLSIPPCTSAPHRA